MKKYFLRNLICIFILFVIISFGFGCLRKGLYRTSLKHWQVRTFPTVGFKANLPKQSSFIFGGYLEFLRDTENFLREYDYKGCRFHFHPVKSGHLSDALHLIDVFVIRMSRESFNKFKHGDHRANYFWKTETTKFEPEIIQRTEKLPVLNATLEYLCFRRDIKAENGDVIIGIARLMTHYSEQTPDMMEEDIKAIKRILTSIKPIPIEKANG